MGPVVCIADPRSIEILRHSPVDDLANEISKGFAALPTYVEGCSKPSVAVVEVPHTSGPLRFGESFDWILLEVPAEPVVVLQRDAEITGQRGRSACEAADAGDDLFDGDLSWESRRI